MALSNVLKKILSYPTRLGALAHELTTAIDAATTGIAALVAAAFGKTVLMKAVDYAILAGDSGKTILASDAVNFTLPAAAAGLSYYIGQTADANMAVLAPSSNDSIICKDDAGADSVTFSTASNKIGSMVLVSAVTLDGGTTYKWFLVNIGGTTATIA